MQQILCTAPLLVVNTGSSSLKLTLFRPDQPGLSLLVERIGSEDSPADHAAALQDALAQWRSQGVLTQLDQLALVAHRLVHGGELFTTPTHIDATVLAQLHALSHLAPLHNPIALQCIEALQEQAPGLPQLACFDTAFHHGLPPHAYRYALPEHYYREHGIRRYGFHGLSLASVCRQAEVLLGRPLGQLKLIVAHLGNGASITAIEGGRSVETSMGLTPLEGLVMGSRSGDLDPSIPLFLAGQLGMDLQAVDQLLNQHSGLRGLCGHGDLRAIHALREQGDADAQLALDIYVHRIRKYLGAYTAVLGQVDALIFTAGVGEHDGWVRQAVCAGLENLGYGLDHQTNHSHRRGAAALHAPTSHCAIWVIPSDEESEIARQAIQYLEQHGVGNE